MPFRINDPKTVLSPVKNISDVDVIFNGGNVPGAYSVAKLKWNGNDVIGVRWNISENESSDPVKIGGSVISLGEPNSRGHSTWFVIPDDLISQLILNKSFTSDLKIYLKEKRD